MFRIIHDVNTGEITQIELTADEVAELQTAQAKAEANIAIKNAEESAKADEKQAILDQLGITAEQAKLLLS
jgi:hypothetical protein